MVRTRAFLTLASTALVAVIFALAAFPSHAETAQSGARNGANNGDYPAAFQTTNPTHFGEIYREKAKPTITKGKIFLRRQTAVTPPEELEAKIERIAGGITAKSESELKKFAQSITAKELAILQKETETNFKSYTNEQLAGLLQQSQLSEERAKRYASEQNIEVQAQLLSKLAENQAALREAEQRIAIQVAKAETSVDANVQILKSAVQAATAENKQYTAEQLATAQRALSAVDAENQRQAFAALNLIQARETNNRAQLATLETQVNLAPQLAEERAKRYALEQQTQLKNEFVTQLKSTENDVQIARLETNTQLANLEHNITLSAEQTKRYAAEQALQSQQANLSEIRRLETALTLADETNHQRLLSQLRATQVELTANAAQSIQKVETIASDIEARRLTQAEIQAITKRTFEGQTDTIRALALQTVAESEPFIKTVTRQALQENDPVVTQALAQAAKNVILDENENITFAIREAVGSEIDRRVDARLASNVAQGNFIQTDANFNAIQNIENIDGESIQIAALATEPSEQQAGAASTASAGIAALGTPRHRQNWVNIRDYHLAIHVDNKTVENILKETIHRAAPFIGPWEIKWKISNKNKDILDERFSLDAETTFEDFVNYLAQYMFNTRGVYLNFKIFDAEHILVVSDE